MDDIKAIRDALAAGPTHGEWVAHSPSLIVRTTDRLYVASVQLDEEDTEAVATLRYIAACHPERIARLLDALELAQRENELRRELVSTGNRMVQELEAKLGAAQKDAERYRWLRTFNVDSYMACGMLNDLDAEIDAAMAASAPESPSAAQSTP